MPPAPVRDEGRSPGGGFDPALDPARALAPSTGQVPAGARGTAFRRPGRAWPALPFAVLALFACQRAPRPNVLLVTIDALRPDRIGAYGHAQARTPTLDALATRGLLFERAFTHAPVTLPAHATLLTGRLPQRHGVRGDSLYRLAAEETTLAETLRAAGYATGAVVGSALLDRVHALDQGFDSYDDRMPSERAAASFGERPADEVVAAGQRWLAALRPGVPFFLWLQLFDPHAPYQPPALFRAEYVASPYDGEVAAVDKELANLLQGLQQTSKLENTLVVVTADHGESLGEHGEATHGVFLYESTVRVPLLVSGPGIAPGRRSDLVGLADVMPSILQHVGVATSASFDGHGLLSARPNGSRPIVLETLRPRDLYRWSPLRALRTERYKLILRPAAELYDLTDEAENVDLAETRYDLVRELRAELDRTPASPEAITSSSVAPPSERLRSLGYVLGAAVAGDGEAPGADPRTRIGLVAELQDALDRLRSGRRASAAATLEEVLQKDPTNFLAAHTLGDVLFDLGREAEALGAYDRAAAGRRGRYYELRRGLLHERLGDFANAASRFRALVANDRGAANEVLQRALALDDAGRSEGARLYLDVLAEAGVADSAFDEQLARARARLGAVARRVP